MTPEQAIQRLVFHTMPEPGGFLDMLRPYHGLKQDVLVDVMDALKASASIIRAATLPRELVSALWCISYLGKMWSLAPDGMIRGNNLINDADLAMLEKFFKRFDWAVRVLLGDGDSIDSAFTDPGPASK